MGLALTACAGQKASPPEPLSGHQVPVEDFEAYTTDAELAKAWYKPGHGGASRSVVGPSLSGRGKQALEVRYETGPTAETHYSAVCRVAKWNLDGTDAVSFWLKPDGSARKLTVELNIANASGKNIHDLWSTVIPLERGDTAPRIVTVPYAKLVQNSKHADAPDVSPVFKPADVIEVAFYVGGRTDPPGAGSLIVDDIVAIKLP